MQLLHVFREEKHDPPLSLFSSFCSKSQTVCTSKYGPTFSCCTCDADDMNPVFFSLIEMSTQPVWLLRTDILLSFSLFFLPVAPIPASSSLSDPLLTLMGRICQPGFFPPSLSLSLSLGPFHICQSGSSKGFHQDCIDSSKLGVIRKQNQYVFTHSSFLCFI